ncbi:MAG: hypothetical protein ACW972_02055 [Promethearchaeota archaeon]|jgi:hypothetical protein
MNLSFLEWECFENESGLFYIHQKNGASISELNNKDSLFTEIQAQLICDAHNESLYEAIDLYKEYIIR